MHLKNHYKKIINPRLTSNFIHRVHSKKKYLLIHEEWNDGRDFLIWHKNLCQTHSNCFLIGSPTNKKK